MSPNWFAQERMDAVDAVLKELAAYQGEKIATGEDHPLRLAVIALEDLVDTRNQIRHYGNGNSKRQQRLLLIPARDYWFQLLSKSRGEYNGDPMESASKLADELRRWKAKEPSTWAFRLQQCGITKEPA